MTFTPVRLPSPRAWPVAIALATCTMLAGTAIAYHAYAKPDRLTRVVDGDTLVINGQTRVRLWGIDAPELGQICQKPVAVNGVVALYNGELRRDVRVNETYPCGQLSADYLRSMLRLNVQLHCRPVQLMPWLWRDTHGRYIMQCTITNTTGQRHDIGKSLVAAGHAVDAPVYSRGFYWHDEQYARRHKLGVWQGAFDMPWDWRKENQK